MPGTAPDPATRKLESRRQFGLLSATALVVASMVGTGVFTTSGFTLADLKTPGRVLAAWIVGGLIAALGATSYGALARRLPESGGEYLFLSRTLHPAAGYVAGWVSFLAGFSAPLAAAALAFGKYTQSWWPAVPTEFSASCLMLGAAVVHSVSVRRGMWLHNAAVALKLAILAAFIGLAAAHLPAREIAAPTPPADGFPWAAFAVSLVWISYSYSGWNAAVYVGGEVRDPERTLPRALLLGTVVVAVLYLILNGIFLAAAPPAQLAGQLEVGRIAAIALNGEGFGHLITFLIACVLVAHVSGLTLAGPRIYAQMARDGCLPRLLAPVAGPPRVAIVLQTTAALVMLWLATYDRLLTYIGFTLSLSTAATVVGLMRLRWKEGPALRVPGWPWVPLLFLAAVLWSTAFTLHLRRLECLWGLAVIALGVVVWRFTRPPSPPAACPAPAPPR